MPADRVEYVFTDLGLLFLNKAREKFAAYGYVRYEVLDIEKDPAAQGFRVAEYDVVVASNVLHATADLRATLEHVRKLLKPDGSLLLMELTERQRWIDLIFGTTEGWWKCTDRAHPLLNREQWPIWLREAGFAQTGVWGSGWRGQSVIVAGAAKEERKHWLILADSKGVGARLATGLEAAGDVCDVVSAGVGVARRKVTSGCCATRGNTTEWCTCGASTGNLESRISRSCMKSRSAGAGACCT